MAVNGRCHICKATTRVVFCKLCDHYFCDSCRGKYWSRGIEFVKQLTGGRTEGCCGPDEGEMLGDTDRP